MVVELLGIALVLLLLFGLPALFRKKRTQDREAAEETLVRSAEHEAAVGMLKLWLANQRIVHVILEKPLATEAGLLATREGLDAMDYETVLDCGSVLLRNREVRQAVANFEMRRGGVTKAEAMRPLLEWARYEKPTEDLEEVDPMDEETAGRYAAMRPKA